MYHLISAIAKPLNGNGRWVDVAIGDVALNTLFSTYSRILATLSNPYLSANVSLDLADVRDGVGGQSITFNAFLVQNGNTSLSTSTDLPIIKPRYVKYADAFRAGYKVTPIRPGSAPDAEATPAEKTSLYLTRPNTDYNLFYQSCLVSVNGFFHPTDAGPDGVYVQGGMSSCMKSRQNQLGLVSFRELGSLSFHPITTDNLYKLIPNQPYKERAYVDLGEDVSNKTVMLVLGGYLHALDKNAFFRVNESCFGIDMANLPLMERYYESKNYLDFTSLSLATTSRNVDQVNVNNFFNEAVMTAYLTLPQSFFVVLDNPDIFVEKELIRKSTMPDVFTSYTKAIYPLVVGVGKLGNYWATKEDGQYSITCRDSVRHDRIFDTVIMQAQMNVANANDPEHPVEASSAFFLKIGTDL